MPDCVAFPNKWPDEAPFARSSHELAVEQRPLDVAVPRAAGAQLRGDLGQMPTRWRSGATDLLQSSLARAIFFSALATGSAFGSLWLSRHPGTASMGKILMISLVWTLVCALLFEPALLGPARGRRDPSGPSHPPA